MHVFALFLCRKCVSSYIPGSYVPYTEAEIQPSLMVTVILLLSTSHQMSESLVNYKGRPFLQDHFDNLPLLYLLTAAFVIFIGLCVFHGMRICVLWLRIETSPHSRSCDCTTWLKIWPKRACFFSEHNWMDEAIDDISAPHPSSWNMSAQFSDPSTDSPCSPCDSTTPIIRVWNGSNAVFAAIWTSVFHRRREKVEVSTGLNEAMDSVAWPTSYFQTLI